MRSFTLGQYVDAESPLHAMDPRIKMFVLAVFMGLVFTVEHPASFALLVVGIVAAAWVAHIPLGFFLGGLRSIFSLVLLTAFFNLLFFQGTTTHALWSLGPLVITQEKIHQAYLISLRIVSLVMATSLLTLTTSPLRLTDGLERLGSPLARLHFPVSELALMVSISLRFIPYLVDHADRLMKAQMARGADLEASNPVRRVRAMVPVLVPLFLQAFQAADELALAMEARCYQGGSGRTRAYRELGLRRVDAWSLQFVLLLVLATSFLERLA